MIDFENRKSCPEQILKSLAKRMTTGRILFDGVPNCEGIDIPRNFEEFHCVHPIQHIYCFKPLSPESLVEMRGFAQVRKPFSVVTSNASAAVKSLAGTFIQRQSTDQFFVHSGKHREHDTVSAGTM